MKNKLETIEAVHEFNIALETAANRLKGFKIDEDRFEDGFVRKNDSTSGDDNMNGKNLSPEWISLSAVSALPYASWSEDLIKAADKLVNMLYPPVDSSGIGHYVN